MAIVSLVVCGSVLYFLRWVGEAHFMSTILLYAPPHLFLLPLPVLFVLAWLTRNPKSYLGVLACSAPAYLAMGCTVSIPSSGERLLRVLAWNVNSGHGGVSQVREAIVNSGAELVGLVEADFSRPALLQELGPHFPYLHGSGEFILASRFPIREAEEPPKIPSGDRRLSPNYYRYLVDAPGGQVVVYLVHPHSPRDALGQVRGEGLRREILSGRIFTDKNRLVVEQNTGLRQLQVETVARSIRAESLPVILLGDTNLSHLSPLYARELGFLSDAFATTGLGSGFTFPARRPFLRIDRILTSPEFRALSVTTACSTISDHLCVSADLARVSN